MLLIILNCDSKLLKLFGLKRALNLKQNIILKKSNKIYANTNIFLEENPYYKDKKLINISPAGLKGFYNLGTCVYISENYNLKDYIFSGVSAGSWNSLIMVNKGNSTRLAYELINIAKKNQDNKTIYELQCELKRKLLKKYTSNDFYLKNIFMGVACFNKERMVSNIYGDFENLNDVIDCAIASSHIPFVTGKYINRYYNYISFDGGITSNKYLNLKPSLTIHQDMWNLEYNEKDNFNPKKNNYTALFLKGYSDAEKNKDYLSSIFEKKID